MTLIFTEDAWGYAKNNARAITINQEQCRGLGGRFRISPAVSVGEPDNKEDYELHNKEDVNVYVVKDFPTDPPSIIIQLKSSKTSAPSFVASRRR